MNLNFYPLTAIFKPIFFFEVLNFSPQNSWVLYEEPNYRGRMYIVERGNYCTHMEWQAENPNIQSIRRVANYF